MHSFCENRLVALIWRLAGLSIGTYGLILMLQASSVKQQLCYFTNQSNLFILILFAGLAVQTAIQIGRNGIHGPVASHQMRPAPGPDALHYHHHGLLLGSALLAKLQHGRC